MVKVIDSEDPDELAEGIVDYYEQKGVIPEEVIRIFEDNIYIVDSVRDRIREREVSVLIGQNFGRIEAPEIPERIYNYREEQWNRPGSSQSISVPRDNKGRFAKGRRVIHSIVKVLLPQSEIREEYYDVPELGEEYRNETWTYPEYQGSQTLDISVPRDSRGRWLKGKRIIRSVSTPAITVDERQYESYQDYGATQ